MLAAPALRGDRRAVRGAQQASGGGEQGPARRVRDHQVRPGLRGAGGGRPGRCGPGGGGRGGLGLEQDRAPVVAVLVGDGLQLGRDHLTQPRVGGEDRLELGDRGLQLVALGLQLDAGESRQLAQPQLQDVVGLHLGEVEDAHEAGARGRGVVRGTDDLDDLVDVHERQQQALDEVEAVAVLAEAVPGAAPHHVQTVVHVDPQQGQQAQGLRLAVDERDVVDPERLLERGVPVQGGQHGLGVEPGLELDLQAQPVLAVRQVHDVGDAAELLRVDAGLDPLDDLLGAHAVRQLGDDQAGAPRGDLLHGDGGPHAERAAAGRVGVADAVEPHDPAARGEVGAGDVGHDRLEVRLGVREQVARARHDLAQVVRGHVRGHADGDAGGAVDEQVGVGGGQHGRLLELVVVVGDEVHGALVEVRGERQGGRGHAGLRVARGRGAVVERAEVAVPVHHGQAQGERLGEADHRVVDRGVAVGVQLAHHLAHHTGGLHVAAVRAQAHAGHHVEDAPLHRLEAVARVRQGARVDHRVGVLEEGRLHLLGDVDVDDVLLLQRQRARGVLLGGAGTG